VFDMVVVGEVLCCSNSNLSSIHNANRYFSDDNHAGVEEKPLK